MTAPSDPLYEFADRFTPRWWGDDHRGKWRDKLHRALRDFLSNGTVQILVSCQVQACAEEHSLYLDMVRMWEGKPICSGCYGEVAPYPEVETAWCELPRVTILDLNE